MINLYIKLNDSDLSFEIAAKRDEKILSTVRGNYQKDLADKLINGISESVKQSAAQSVLKQKKAPTCGERFMVSGIEPSRTKKAKGLDKNSAYVKLKKRDKFRVYYDSSSKSFVSSLISNSVASIFNWLEK